MWKGSSGNDVAVLQWFVVIWDIFPYVTAVVVSGGGVCKFRRCHRNCNCILSHLQPHMAVCNVNLCDVRECVRTMLAMCRACVC